MPPQKEIEGYKLELLYPSEEIKGAVQRLAQRISGDYQGKYPLFLGVLRGCFIFLSDLVRSLSMPLEVDFIQVSRYVETSGSDVRWVKKSPSISGRDVVVVEDIVDEGITLNFVLSELSSQLPASLKVCTLLNKPSRRKIPVPVDYCGFDIPDLFVVGYGFDVEGRFRELPAIYFLK
jgi:hypoxanthine phosphoribosyltransferase